MAYYAFHKYAQSEIQANHQFRHTFSTVNTHQHTRSDDGRWCACLWRCGFGLIHAQESIHTQTQTQTCILGSRSH